MVLAQPCCTINSIFLKYADLQLYTLLKCNVCSTFSFYLRCNDRRGIAPSSYNHGPPVLLRPAHRSSISAAKAFT